MIKGLKIYYKSFFGITLTNSMISKRSKKEIIKIQLIQFDKPIWVNVEDLKLSINN